MHCSHFVSRCLAVALFFSLLTMPLAAQDRLKAMPGYEQYQKMAREIPASIKSGAVAVRWLDGGQSFEFPRDGKMFRYDLASKRLTETGAVAANATAAGRGGGRRGAPGVQRGRQAASADSPDGQRKAFYRDRNLWLSDASGANEIALTSDGNEKSRIKYGIASWVYGEELEQTTAMWWSPDSKKIAFYRFDESKVPDYFLQLNQTALQSTMDIEAYPKAGVANPIADLLIYDVTTKQLTKVDARDGKPFENGVIGHYIYNVRWSADGSELLFYRTNRRQNILELAAANAATGKCRVVVREEWLPSWVDYQPTMRYLKDRNRFIWSSLRTGFRNYYLYDLSGKMLATLTKNPFEVVSIVSVDEDAGVLYYLARSGDNYLKYQLHRVGLDGKGDQRLTDPAFHHTVNIAPDHQHFVDIAQTHDTPPSTRLLDMQGKVVEEIAKSDTTRFEQQQFQRVELFKFKAADGQTDLFGLLHKPSNFDPNKKYPVLLSVYGGPEFSSNTASEVFTLPDPRTEYGFLVVNLDTRAVPGQGKKVLDALYQHLGVTEIDDMAAGIKSLWNRSYFDKNRVGVFGTSYGGYSSVMCLLRHPEAFQAASASSAVTSWHHYDTIYTERYMWIPQENPAGYDAGNAMKYAANLQGRLMIYYGTADNNVHPNNAMQLIQALQQAGKSFEVQVGPDQGHSGIRPDRMMEFFIENLVLKPATAPATSAVGAGGATPK